MCDVSGKADGLFVSTQIKLGNWRQWPGDICQWLRIWCYSGAKPNAAWVREDGKGGYEWSAWMPNGKISEWQSCQNGQEGRDAADEWLMSQV